MSAIHQLLGDFNPAPIAVTIGGLFMYVCYSRDSKRAQARRHADAVAKRNATKGR